MPIKPVKLRGPWDEGYALDVHTTSSEYIGDDVYGHPQYDNEYSDMGQLVNSYKYKKDYRKLDDIIALAKPFIESWETLNTVDFVLPVPSSKYRDVQPAEEVAREIASMIGAYYSNEILQKESPMESKGLSGEAKQRLQGTITKTKNATKEHNMLLVDDIFQSGTTLGECIKVLREDPKIVKIFVLTLTKTRKETE